MDTPPSANLRSRPRPSELAPPSGPSSKPQPTMNRPAARNPPLLPTPLESAVLAAYPVLLVFGSLFSLVNPSTRSAAYDPLAQAHSQDPALAPNYFARKDNVFNTLFVKRGWAWITLAFALFATTHAGFASAAARARAAARWALVTAWWVLVTQWCFGPPLIDRGFRYTGGKCAIAERRVEEGDGGEVLAHVTAAACKGAGGRWSGGHDISGHVFMLVLGSAFLVQEVGWVIRRRRAGLRDERSIVMHDGAVKSAEVEAETVTAESMGAAELGIGGQAVAVVVVLSGWMILMTAIYFHTWFEKLTGLMVALAGLYAVYGLPRFVPAVRKIVGLPGI